MWEQRDERTRTWLRRGSAALSFLAIAGALGACDTETTIRYVDPYVEHEVAAVATVTGEAELDVGMFHEQFFDALSEGEDMPLIHGFQGGVWIMPALRIQGIASPATVSVALDVIGGSRICEAESKANFLLATDGWLEIQAFPARVDYATWKIHELYGLDAVLEVSVTDEDGRSDQVSLQVHLIEG